MLQLSAIVATRRLKQEPSCPIASAGACCLVVSLTALMKVFSYRILKKRSRITLNCLLLCGIHAAGDTFSWAGIWSLMSPYFTIFAKPYWTLVRASALSAALAAGDSALLCSPCWIAVSIWAFVHARLQSAGHPLVKNFCKSGMAGCCKAYVQGHINPSLPIFSFVGRSSGIVGSLLIASFVARLISFCLAAGGRFFGWCWCLLQMVSLMIRAMLVASVVGELSCLGSIKTDYGVDIGDRSVP